ncbi:MAG: hypothetical protein WBX15_01535 [Thermoanaerobaculia bacterium]
MNCVAFRELCRKFEQTPEMLAHLRACNECLEFAVAIDPDYLFRSLGGDELIPPGGVDAFVSDVMSEVHVRSTERKLQGRRRIAPVWRWSAAAALFVGIVAASLTYAPSPSDAVPGPAVQIAAHQTTSAVTPVMTRPVVENYRSSSATIVEVPVQNASDIQVVMVFDDSLPADL